MRDIDVRKALHRTHLMDFHNDANSRVVDELEICRGEARIDIAVINGSMHGYEIKSDSDTLERLSGQIESYSKVFDYVTLVVGEGHLEKAQQIIPDWWGVSRAKVVRGRLYLKGIKSGKKNKLVDPFAVSQLLWRPEAVGILQKKGLLSGVKSKPKEALCRRLVEALSLAELSKEVREAIKLRQGWRSVQPQRRNGGSSPRLPKLFDCPDHMCD